MAGQNPWFTAVEQTLPEYIPLPTEQLFRAGQAVQNRYDTSMANIDEVGTGLSSIETRLSGHKQYVDNLAGSYRQEIDGLLKKYNNNPTDPQFTREFSRVKNKYANDRNLSEIKLANEAAKRNEGIAAQMMAEGKLFVNPTSTGLDANGNIISDAGSIRQVNTLDTWGQRLKAAADTFNEEGNFITNKTSLTKARKQIEESVKTGAPEVVDLVQAYETRGMSRENAINQVAQDAQRLSGEYTESSRTNMDKLRFQETVRANREQAALQKARLNLEIASKRAEAQGKALNAPPRTFETTFTEAPGARDNITGKSASSIIPTTVDVLNTGINVPLYGRGVTTINRKLDPGTTLKTGKVHEINSKWNNSYKVKNTYKTGEDAVEVAPEALFVFTSGKNAGKIVSKDESVINFGGDGTSESLDIKKDEHGTYYILSEDGREKMHIQPRSMMKITDGDDKVAYRELSNSETLEYFGPEYGYLSGERKSINRKDPSYRRFASSLREKAGRDLTQWQVDAKYYEDLDYKEWSRQSGDRGNRSTEDSFSKRLRKE